MKNGLGVQARVVIAAVLPMLVIAILLTAYYTTAQFADIEEAHTARAQALARQVAAASEYAVFSGNRDALQRVATATLAEEGVLAIAVVDHLGDVLARSARNQNTLALPDAVAMKPMLLEHDAIRRIVEPIVPGSIALDDPLTRIAMDGQGRPPGLEVLGNVIIDLSQEPVRSQRAELQRNGALAVLFALVGALALAFKMSRGVSGPIREVARTVERIGQGHFAERVPTLGGGSLRSLAEGVNRMAVELADSHGAMSQRIIDATAELRARKDEAELANLAKTRFLAAASHDLRQPMHALSLFIASLAEHRLPPLSAHLVEQICASAAAMEALLDSLLDISRLDAGALQPRIQPVELQGVFERVAASILRAASEHDVRLVIRTTGAWVESDPILLERVVANLVGNAVRYAPGGRVLIACRRRGERWRIEVRDNGIGIAADSHTAIFGEFVQLNNPERARDKGLGLGLAIVERLGKMLDHPVSLRSRPGEGAVFALEARSAAPDGQAAATFAERPPGDLQGIHVAVVENDAPTRAKLGTLLRSWGCQVSSGANVAEVMAAIALNGHPPRLMLCEHSPAIGIDGNDTIRTLTTHFGAILPAALLGDDAPPNAVRGAHGTPVPVLRRPIRPAKLRAILIRSTTVQD